MAKNFGVRKSPVSPYQLGTPYWTGSAAKAPGRCLSMPMAMPRSYSPSRRVLAACVSALAAVAQPL